MNDYERARWLLPEGTDEVEVRELAACLAAARREGAEEMRERVAQEFRMAAKAADTREDVVLARRYRLVASIVASLPLTPEEPA